MNWLFFIFLGIALILWITTFGYLFVLSALSYKRERLYTDGVSFPEITVVIPALNEESLISAKLANLRESTYPSDRMKIIVVDGGSSDKTPVHVNSDITHHENIELIRLPKARARPDQINHILEHLDSDIVVFTDADARLEPSCIPELVSCLLNDPSTAIVGAFIRPSTNLLEERLYWWFLSHLWLLEGEVLSSANISGVCYAARREQIMPLAWDAYADDINVALSASARGQRVRICRQARADEIRVPQTASDLVRFRRKRGKAYLTELKRISKFSKSPLKWKLAHRIRLWHFLITPKAIPFFIILAILLIFTPYWPHVLIIFGGFILSVFLAMFISDTKKGMQCRWWQLPIAVLRLAVLTVASMLTLNQAQRVNIYQGG